MKQRVALIGLLALACNQQRTPITPEPNTELTEMILKADAHILMLGGRHRTTTTLYTQDDAYVLSLLPHLAKQGYKTLLLEHITSAWEGVIEYYAKTGDESTLLKKAQELRARSNNYHQREYFDDQIDIMITAHTLGLRVQSYGINPRTCTWAERNRLEYEAIKPHLWEKSIIFCGSNHLCFNETAYGVVLSKQYNTFRVDLTGKYPGQVDLCTEL